jgi:hypothetical protein
MTPMEAARETIIRVISNCMTKICDEDVAAAGNWRNEANAFVKAVVQKANGPVDFSMENAPFWADELDWWQNERIAKNSNFPLAGAN